MIERMELRQLRSFVVVAEEMNVGRAAMRLHLTQPSLSRQIAALEHDLGVELFARVKRRFVLTAAGEAFLADARDLLRRSDEVVRTAQRTQRGQLGTLRLRFVQSATFEALPRILAAFREAYPDVVLDLETLTTLRQTEALRDGQIDVGLLRPSTPTGGDAVVQLAPRLASRVVAENSLVAVLPARHRLARRKRGRLPGVGGGTVVFFSPPPRPPGARTNRRVLPGPRVTPPGPAGGG